MKKELASYFSFSRKELNGILVLFVIIILILLTPYCYRFFDEPETYDLSSFEKEVALFKASAKKEERDYTPQRKQAQTNELKPDYFEFDPNTASEAEWQRFGLSDRQIKVISNYRYKGGKFRRTEDLKKIYSIGDIQYQNLEPYIKIDPANIYPVKFRKLPETTGNRMKKEPEVVEVNSADSAMLDGLRGIGPAFASRIIRFRNRLGGFYNKKQLMEVYGMDSLRYSQIEKQLTVDSSSLKALNINTAAFDDLRIHPYLTFKQINAIIQYRKQHGKYTSAEDLRKVLILNEEIIRKITPYLSF